MSIGDFPDDGQMHARGGGGGGRRGGVVSQASAKEAARDAFATVSSPWLGREREDQYDHEITAFYRQWSGKVLGYLLNMGTDPGLSEEITNDAFLAARPHWAKVRAYEHPEGYIFKIARNEWSKRQSAHDHQAKELHPDLSELPRSIAADLGELLADRAAVGWALRQLPPTLREAVTLRHIEDLAVATVADIMHVSQGTVKRYTFEGCQRLRTLLADFHHPGEEGNDQ